MGDEPSAYVHVGCTKCRNNWLGVYGEWPHEEYRCRKCGTRVEESQVSRSHARLGRVRREDFKKMIDSDITRGRKVRKILLEDDPKPD